MQLSPAQPRICAILGPTNTGKTHFAMDRMLGHTSGMIGFPLRLLARENYEKAVRLRGARQVALITGEEKIIPPQARYFLCTVEAMPLDRPVEFLAVDEVQMCADPDRGHVFTDRLLNARGLSETVFLGADTVRPLIRQLIPDVEFSSRPRMSTLTYSGYKKTTRLPPRSAIVAFSASQVYGLAELVRRQRGGAAVVMGALSPRTRNAQVAMYQAGEVDYLVATDAIGMGLNMDVDHVAFAGTAKFDGRRTRSLTAAELAQAAGRAGRHMNDGTFGTTAEEEPLPEETVEAIETHTFEPLRGLFWRNTKLDFSSVPGLLKSLSQKPPHRSLARARAADDEVALRHVAEDSEIISLASTKQRIELLWDVCRVPDFQKIMSDAHAGLLSGIYKKLCAPGGRLPEDWLAPQITRLDRVDGDIETLTQRIANIRTWTYISFHSDWLENAAHWQERTRSMEDRLSDALHERLTQRFVDPGTAMLVSRLKDQEELLAAVTASGDVVVEGQLVGTLDGFAFDAHAVPEGQAGRAVSAAASRALRSEIGRRVTALEQDTDAAFGFASLEGSAAGTIAWRGAAVARLVRGAGVLAPDIRVTATDLLEPADRDRIVRRLRAWFDAHTGRLLQDLFRLRDADLKGAPKGLAFQIAEALGSLPRTAVAEQLALLTREDRQALKALGLRLGRESVYLSALLKPAVAALRGLLWCVHEKQAPAFTPPMPGRTSVAADRNIPDAYYEVVGFRRLGALAVRLDTLERIAARAWGMARKGEFEAGAELMTLAGCGASEIRLILKGLGFKAREVEVEVEAKNAGEGGAEPENEPEKEKATEKVWRYRRPIRPQAGKAQEKRQDSRGRKRDEKQGKKTSAQESPAGSDGKRGRKAKRKTNGTGDAHDGPRPPRGGGGTRRKGGKQPDPDSPFAALSKLLKA